METTHPPAFGALLRRLRTEAALTHEELAEQAYLSARAVSDLERGVNTTPRPFMLSQLAEAFDLSPVDRAGFERAAAAAAIASQPPDALRHGRFLGAIPEGDVVARDGELETVGSILDSVTQNAGHLLLLSGEDGSGKTRLLQELSRAARQHGFTVLTARCFASEQSAAYHPFLQAIAGLPSSLPIAARGESQNRWKQIQEQWRGGPGGQWRRHGRAEDRGSGPRHPVAGVAGFAAGARLRRSGVGRPQ